MRVLYIHQHFGTPAGTSGTRSYEFARRLLAAGHSVTMVCGASGRSESGLSSAFVNGRRAGQVDGIDVVEFSIGYSTADNIIKRIGKFLRFGASAAAIAVRGQYDLIFATSTPLTAGIPGILAKWLRRKPFVFEVRDLWPELPKALGVKNPVLLLGMSAIEWASYRSADRVIGLAPGIVDGVRSRGIAPDRTVLVPNGCDIEMFDRFTPEHPSSRFVSAIEPDDFVAIYAGAHGTANGLEALLPVAAELKGRGVTKVKLLLIGSGATKPLLLRQAVEQRVEDILIFSDGIPKLQLIPLLKGAQAGLQILKNVPAFYNGTSPNKFFDYLAAGTPVFVNYPGWIATEIEESGAGVVIPPDNPTAFADALIAAAADPEGWRARRTHARVLAAAKFDRHELSGRFVAVLEEAGIRVQVPDAAAVRTSGR